MDHVPSRYMSYYMWRPQLRMWWANQHRYDLEDNRGQEEIWDDSGESLGMIHVVTHHMSLSHNMSCAMVIWCDE